VPKVLKRFWVLFDVGAVGILKLPKACKTIKIPSVRYEKNKMVYPQEGLDKMRMVDYLDGQVILQDMIKTILK
jgi:hypothetical protein